MSGRRLRGKRMFDVLLEKKVLPEFPTASPEKFRGLPSLALPAICAMDDYLTREMKVFCWGSGMSDIFFARRAGSLISIEHDPRWSARVQSALDYWDLKTHYFLIEPGEGYDPEFGSYQAGYGNVNFKDYVSSILIYPDESFDLILVDGRARCACLKVAQSKLKPGGLLVLDDSARSIYQWAIAEIKWPRMALEGCIPYLRHGHIVRTTLWLKE